MREDTSAEGSEHLVDVSYVDQLLPQADSVVWSLEPSANVIPPQGLPKILESAPMRRAEFEALRRAVRWGALTCFWSNELPDAPILAPVVSGVQTEDYQLIPLAKALSMPRVSLALFDDVGLGKTIEAGLVINELIRRRRIRRILVLCPAWLRKQWQDELSSKFGLDFDLIDRDGTSQLRRQIGMEANPWAIHPRAIASYHYLKQEDVLSEFLLASHSGVAGEATLPWDLLIVDEVHNCTPAAHGADSDLARLLERIGKLFEHKVFLSATPHNGFTQSFTGLLTLLDPVRFAKKDSITAAERKRVSEVVVRRLKRDINGVDVAEGRKPRFVERRLQPAINLDFEPAERSLYSAFEMFRTRFKQVVGASRDPGTRIAGNFVIEVLSKRLLSCPYAFAVSWSRFRQGLTAEEEATSKTVSLAANEARAETDRDDELEIKLNSATRLAGAWSKSQLSFLSEAIQGIERCLKELGFVIDGEEVGEPKVDARLSALINLICEQIKGVDWRTGERLIVFTEYRTTLDYLLAKLNKAFPGEPEGRFLQIYGGMPDSQREAIKEAFNDPSSPVRVLLATDAASEGANLQETARMILHFDFPWNPSRVDQRNGRLDRHGQSRDVLVYHFTSDADSDLRFFHRLFEKLETIREELGSMGKIFDEAIRQRFEISAAPTPQALINDDELMVAIDRKTEAARRRQRADLESSTETGKDEQKDLSRFREIIDLSAETLRETLEVAVSSSGEAFRFRGPEDQRRYRLDNVPREFAHTVNATLRRQTKSGAGSLFAVQFSAEDQIVEIDGRSVYRPAKDSTLLHLGHPFVRQALQSLAVSRFPGAKRHRDLSRWTITQAQLEPGLEAIVTVTVEELAINELRETFHQWVTTLRFPIRQGDVGERLPYATPVQERGGSQEAPERKQEAQGIWAQVGDQLQNELKKHAQTLNAKLQGQLQKERGRVERYQATLSEERKEALVRQLSRGIDAKMREIEDLKARIGEMTLFQGDHEIHEIDRKRQEDIQAMVDEERRRVQESISFLEAEQRRIIDVIVPKRYTMVGSALVVPIGVEICLAVAAQ